MTNVKYTNLMLKEIQGKYLKKYVHKSLDQFLYDSSLKKIQGYK